MHAFIVTVTFPEPLIGHARVEVKAFNHAHASVLARLMRSEKRWPSHCTYTPRLVKHDSYEPPKLWLDSRAGEMFDEQAALLYEAA